VTVPNSIAGIIRERAARSPDHVAICGEGRTITFGELDERSNRLANALAALGVSKGDRVVYVDRNATEYWEVAFATAKLGAAITPLNFRLSGGEIATIIADAEPSAAVLSAQVARELGQSWAPRGLPLLLVGGEGDLAGAQDYEEVMTAHGAHDPGGAATGTELAVLMYSSGTTGASKGVRVTASNLLAGVDNFTREFTPDASSSSLVPPPYYHIAASGWSLIAMNAGGRIVQVRDPMPERLLELMVAERTTHAALVPVIIRMLVEMPEAQEADFTSLRTVVYGSSPIAPGLLARAVDLFDAEFTQSYGLTETVGIGTLLRPDDHRSGDPTRLKSAGRPAADVELRIVEPGSGTTLTAGEVGEIVLRGPTVTPGYWRQPEETKRLFLDGGWLRTGDAGYQDQDGYVFIVDRIKDIIVSGGENIVPAEIENVLAAHPAVLEVAVVGVPSSEWGETPRAFVARRDGSDVSEAELLGFCREHLAHFKCPSAILWIDALPRNPSGKVLRRELRRPFWEESDRSVG
jgi:long-chain acyl-CoA synthetase